MTTVLLLACAGLITGFFILIGLKPLDFTDGIFKMLLGGPKSLKDEIKESTKQKLRKRQKTPVVKGVIL